jgi:hypothetical protein
MHFSDDSLSLTTTRNTINIFPDAAAGVTVAGGEFILSSMYLNFRGYSRQEKKRSATCVRGLKLSEESDTGDNMPSQPFACTDKKHLTFYFSCTLDPISLSRTLTLVKVMLI